MKKKLLLLATLVVLFVFVFALSISAARIENYDDTFELKNEASIAHYYTWKYTEETTTTDETTGETTTTTTEKTVNRGYTDQITIVFKDEQGNVISSVPLWEYDAETGKYYSLVWYISEWDYVYTDTQIEDSTAGTQTRPVYTSAVYTLTKVRAVELKFYGMDWRGNLTAQSEWQTNYTINGEPWAHSGETLKVLQGIYLDVNNTPDDKTDDLRLNHARGMSRYSDGAKYGDYEGQFAAQGNKIVVANFRDCDFQRDAYENYGASSTWVGATHLQYLAYPDTVLYLNGGIGGVYEIDLGEGIEIIDCQLLRDNKKVESLVLPNSLLYIGNEAFRGATVKNIVIGEGLLYAPTNINLWKSGNFENIYLSKNILTVYQGYLTKREGNGSSLLEYVGTTNIYFDGNLEQATALVARMIEENSSFDGKLSIVDYQTTTERGDLKNTVIFYNYNRCEAFYRGQHLFATTACICDCTREGCGLTGLVNENGIHTEGYLLSSSNEADEKVSYTAMMYRICQCSTCKTVSSYEEIGILFTLKGYSNATGAIMQGFGVNKEAIEKYNSYAENDIKYGILAANGALGTLNIGTSFVNGVISVDFTNRSYDIMEMKIYGITSATQDTQLYCCGYIEVDGEIIYMDEKMASDATLPTAVSYAGLGGTFAQTASLDAVVPTKEEVLA